MKVTKRMDFFNYTSLLKMLTENQELQQSFKFAVGREGVNISGVKFSLYKVISCWFGCLCIAPVLDSSIIYKLGK